VAKDNSTKHLSIQPLEAVIQGKKWTVITSVITWVAAEIEGPFIYQTAALVFCLHTHTHTSLSSMKSVQWEGVESTVWYE